ncbi:MAG: penicillin-binding protein 1C [Phycisphaerae bacterium]|nr:penicillin-binding protein 1C [Phycisphaerae bacterium]
MRWLARGLLIAGLVAGGSFVAAWHLSPFPAERLQRFSPSPTVADAQGRHLLSIVSQDEQWSMPVGLDAMSPRLVQATIATEDQRYYDHCGVDILAAGRAAVQNMLGRRVISGASTITMQVCRMMDDRPRTLAAKVIESFRAMQLTRLKSKQQVLEIYLNTAPYGGNIRGVEAASLLYFSKHACDLSLAEAALLAGLPKSPTRYNPRTHLEAALKRQQTVLDRMQETGVITPEERRLAASASLAINDLPRMRHAPHAAWMALGQRPLGGRTWINLEVQRDAEYLACEHLKGLPDGTEIAIVVIDIQQSAIVTLVGSGDVSDPVDGQVNGALAKRSPGSALKPFIYAAAFEAGRLSPESIVYDVPVNLGGWEPENFDRTFATEVTAAEALQRSLNSPVLQVARGVGLGRCCGLIESAGICLPANVASRAGLAVAVGGVEVSLLELTDAYACMGRGGKYRKARLFVDEAAPAKGVLSTNVCRAIDAILSSHARRPNGMADLLPENVPWFMWKTGTSSGRRDAWAIGHNGRWAAGVWIGRFRGTGRFEYVGSQAAEPLLSRLFALPSLRMNAAPSVADPILVRKPLPVPSAVRQNLQIVRPADGDIFISPGGELTVRPAANKAGNLTWFLNGRLLGLRSPDASVDLGAGRYTLLCVDDSGGSCAVSFEVK